MLRVLQFMSLSVLVVVGLLVAGCSKRQSGQESAAPPDGASHAQPMSAEHGGHDQHEDVLAELSPEDRALVEKQKTCPVSGDPLGAMGKPYKVTVQGREVFLCCPGCEAKIKENPEKYLAKLPK